MIAIGPPVAVNGPSVVGVAGAVRATPVEGSGEGIGTFEAQGSGTARRRRGTGGVDLDVGRSADEVVPERRRGLDDVGGNRERGLVPRDAELLARCGRLIGERARDGGVVHDDVAHWGSRAEQLVGTTARRRRRVGRGGSGDHGLDGCRGGGGGTDAGGHAVVGEGRTEQPEVVAELSDAEVHLADVERDRPTRGGEALGLTRWWVAVNCTPVAGTGLGSVTLNGMSTKSPNCPG